MVVAGQINWLVEGDPAWPVRENIEPQGRHAEDSRREADGGRKLAHPKTKNPGVSDGGVVERPERHLLLLGGSQLLREASLDAVRFVAMDDARLGGLVSGGSHGGRAGGSRACDEALDEALEAGANDLIASGASNGLADALLVSFDVGHVCQ